ncbi:MAG: hypothetical protein LBR26_13235 [Prevotella sp.]|jgi:hypothetical protein|nr:hypothetical protein [Prevotella sp.]
MQYIPPDNTQPGFTDLPIDLGALQIVVYPYKYAFAGNPMIFGITSNSQDEIIVGVKVGDGDIFYFSLVPYGTVAPYRATIDICGFVRNRLDGYALAGDGFVFPVDNFSTGYSVYVNGGLAFSGIAFRGGISKSLALQLAAENFKNIFDFRLLKFTRQFIFTTRTHGNIIRIRDTELSPFMFIHPGRAISFVSGSGSVINTPAMTKGAVCAMNLEAIYNRFLEMGESPSMIKVSCISGYASFTFAIQPGVIAEERYLLRFLNSLGAFELVEVTGYACNTPSFSEENKWESMNVLGFFEENRERVSSVKAFEVEAGYKIKKELDFICDMIQSEEIYFIRPDGYTCRCLVTAENIRYRHRIVAPSSVLLKIREIAGSVYASPDEPALPDLLVTEHHKDCITTEDKFNLKI